MSFTTTKISSSDNIVYFGKTRLLKLVLRLGRVFKVAVTLKGAATGTKPAYADYEN